MAQVLATTSLDLEQRELVTAMVFSADVLLAIISDVLDLSKVESGMTSIYLTFSAFDDECERGSCESTQTSLYVCVTYVLFCSILFYIEDCHSIQVIV